VRLHDARAARLPHRIEPHAQWCARRLDGDDWGLPGLAPGFAGLAQINARIPSGLTPGNQPVFVTINGLPSNAGLITGR
jgi:hypothetical protein